MFFLENRLSDINVIYIKIQSKTSHYSNFNENKQMPSKKTPKSPGKGGKVRTPPKSTPTGQEAFPSLELTDEAVKAQYRLFVTELEQSKVREAAEAIWKQNDSPASPDSDKIYDHIKGLSAILPVYLEGLLGLCDEERGDVVPLAWWRKYVKTIDEAWFATMFPRLPQESFSRTHDAEYYDLDNEDWMPADQAIVELNCTMCDLFNAVQQSSRPRQGGARFELYISGHAMWVRATNGEAYRAKSQRNKHKRHR